MTVRELYKMIQDRFPKEMRDLNHLAWPLHQPSMGVQFVDKNGMRLGHTAIVDPVIEMVPEPLEGPFYDLNAVGFAPRLPLGKKWKQISIVVEDKANTVHNLPLTLSSLFYLRTKASQLKGLASDLGIEWYHVNFKFPWHFTCVPTLDDCVKYERETNKDSL